METQEKESKSSFGGKTIGTAGGFVSVYLCSSLPPDHPLKQWLLYVSPVVAVWCKDLGGALAYSGVVYFVQVFQEYKLGRLEKRISRIPDIPEAEQIKKNAKTKLYNVSAEIINAELDEIQRLTDYVKAKGKKKDVEKE